MGLLDWLKWAFSAPAPYVKDAGFMVREGKELRWARARLPIDVMLHPSAADYFREYDSAVRMINTGLGIKVFMLPTTVLTDSMADAWEHEKKRDLLRGMLLVKGTGMYAANKAHLGDSDLRYDKRSGEILNVLTTLPPKNEVVDALGQQYTWQMVAHECGHVMGLDHDGDQDSIMWRALHPHATQLLSADVGRLRKAYGP